jgi:hypothetical protein
MTADENPKQYCEDVTRVKRRPTRTEVGRLSIGSSHPIVKQTMSSTVTREVEASVSQILKIAAEGGDLVRLTVQGRFEADAATAIRDQRSERVSGPRASPPPSHSESLRHSKRCWLIFFSFFQVFLVFCDGAG